MPQYELMYILSSAIPDSDEPKITKQLTDFIVEAGGEILKVENLGKKKLAYPIKRTRNGMYVLVNFKMPTDKVHELDHKIRVTGGVIRHLVLNLEDSLLRQAKDLEEQKLIRRSRREPLTDKKEVAAIPAADRPKIQIDLDKQIEKALEEDITK